MKPISPPISQEEVRAHLAYDPSTGSLNRLKARKPWLVGKIAGTIVPKGYRTICIGRKYYYSHRLVWFMHHNEWPSCDIDHIDRNRDNNRIENLRLAGRSENNVNSATPKNNTSGFKGAYLDRRRGMWAAEIWVHGKKKFLGYFNSAALAGDAYRIAARRAYGEFAPK